MTQEEKEKLKEAQDSIALYFINHYEGIYKIEFVDFKKGGFGLSDIISLNINDTTRIGAVEAVVDTTYDFTYRRDSFFLIKKESPTNLTDLSSIEINYYTGER